MTTKDSEPGLAARLLHGARDLIWQDDPAQRRTAAPVQDAAPAVPTAAAPPALRLATDAAPANNAMTAELLAVVMSRPTAYSALADAIGALADIPMDEATRYRTSFAVLKKTQQRTVDQVTQAIDVHLGVLESEQTRFAGQSKNAEDAQITARINEVEALRREIEEGERQIEKLRTDTDALVRQIQDDQARKQTRADALARETEQKKEAIAQTMRNFEGASAAVRSTLTAAKAKVQQYLA
ncbi:MAG: hypothetical protein V4582_24475 [Pseudomonadota bacterium]